MGADSQQKGHFSRKAALDEEDFKLSNAEKRQRVENELCELQKRCKSARLTPSEIEACARPFLECVKRKERVRLLKRVVWCSLIVAAVSGIFVNQTTSDWVTTHLRLFSIKVILPYWDFAAHYNEYCLIDNPLYDENSNRAELNCDICKELGKTVESMEIKDADPSVIFRDYLQENVPLVMRNAFNDWKALTELDSAEKLHEVYEEDPILKRGVCDVSGISSFSTALKKMKSDKTRSLSVMWRNCEKDSYKQFRKFYRRAPFLPGAAEAVHSNFVILSTGTEKATRRQTAVVPSELSSAIWIGQVKGKLQYSLTAVRDCAKQCKNNLVVTLKPGDFMLVPLELWEVNFEPLTAQAEDAVAIGSGLMWDVTD